MAVGDTLRIGSSGDQEFATPAVKFASRLITSAELLAIGTTPITIVPAKAGTIFVIVRVEAYFHAGATPYTWADGINVVGTDASYGVGVGPDLLSTAVDGFVDAGSVASAVFTDVSLFINIPIILTGGPGSPTDGDGTLGVYVQYIEIVP